MNESGAGPRRVRRLLPLALLALVSCGRSAPPEPPWGVTIVVKISKPPDASWSVSAEAARIVEDNLARLGFAHAQARLLEDDRMSIRIPGVDASNLRRAGRALADGSPRVHATADAQTQMAYTRTRGLPAGYQAFANVDPAERPGPPWHAEVLLLKAEPLVGERGIADAWTEGSDVILRLKRDARKGFDAALRDGPLAVVLDGRLIRAGRMSDRAPGGHARITTFRREDAENLASVLRMGNLPVQLGLGRYGSCSPRETESLEFYGTPPAK